MSLYGLRNVNLDLIYGGSHLVSIFVLLRITRLFVIIYVASYSEIDYIKGPLLLICEQVSVAVMYGRANLEVLPCLQRLTTVSVINV
jgi:hypothetical protein